MLHTGADTLPFGDRLAALPISGLWNQPSRFLILGSRRPKRAIADEQRALIKGQPHSAPRG
jgi:hypothetical protein